MKVYNKELKRKETWLRVSREDALAIIKSMDDKSYASVQHAHLRWDNQVLVVDYDAKCNPIYTRYFCKPHRSLKRIKSYLRKASKQKRLEVYSVTDDADYYVVESDLGTMSLKKSFIDNITL